MRVNKPIKRVLISLLLQPRYSNMYVTGDDVAYRAAIRDCLAALNGERPASWPADVWLHKWQVYLREQDRKHKEAMEKGKAITMRETEPDLRGQRQRERLAMRPLNMRQTRMALRSIANPEQAEREYGGFDDMTILIARSALLQIARLARKGRMTTCDMAYAGFARLYPHEAHKVNPARFWKYFHAHCPGVPRAEMARMLTEAEEDDQ